MWRVNREDLLKMEISNPGGLSDVFMLMKAGICVPECKGNVAYTVSSLSK